MSTIYPGRIVEMTEAGPKVMVPALARDATWGPVSTIVAGLQLGDQVAVTNLGDSRDALLILGRMGGIEIGSGGEITIDDVAELRPELDAIDIRVDALVIDQGTDRGVLGEHGDRLDDIDAGQLTQNTRLTAAEGVNTTQNTRLTATEGVATGAASTASAAQTAANSANTAAGTAQTTANNAQTTANAAQTTANAAATTTALNTLRADTAGKATTKGDLLAATGSGVLARQAVGTNGLALVADSSQAAGLAWAERRGQPLLLTGATSPTRYVGATSVAGPPATGTWSNGDFSIDSVGHVWVRAGGAWKGWTKDHEDRMVKQEGNGNHIWTATGDLVHNLNQGVFGWNVGSTAGIATVDSNGYFRLNRAGRWGITLYGNLDHPINGYFQLQLEWINGPMEPNEVLLQGDHRQEGYAGCGFSWVHVTWSGWVTATQATNAPFRLMAYQSNRTGTKMENLPLANPVVKQVNYYALINYMGGG